MLGFSPLCTRPITGDFSQTPTPPPVVVPGDTHDGFYGWDDEDIRRLYDRVHDLDRARRDDWKKSADQETALREELEVQFGLRPRDETVSVVAPLLKSKTAVAKGKAPHFVLSTNRLEELLDVLRVEINRIERQQLELLAEEDDMLLLMAAALLA